MLNTQKRSFLSRSVKKTPLFVFNILFILFSCSCSSSPHRAPVSSVGQPSSSKLDTHIVDRGDTLFSIAWRYGLDYKNLSKINRIYPPYGIYPGQVIQLKGVAPRVDIEAPVVVEKKPVMVKSPWARPVKVDTKRVEKPTQVPLAVKTQSVKSSSLVWMWPLRGRLISSFSSSGGLNKGIDIAAKLGESVRAAADGEVVYAGSGLRGYGKLLIIKHQDSYLSAYAHSSKLIVKDGDVVKRGQVIAEVGTSGSGVNDGKLHFEIRRDGVPVDPVSILPR